MAPKKPLPARVAVADVREQLLADLILLGYEDLHQMGYVSSRADLSRKVASGVLPRPFKQGDTQQAGAKWVAGQLRRHVEARSRIDAPSDAEGGPPEPVEEPDTDTAGRRERRVQRHVGTKE